jgi:hypothetical protein
MKNSRGVLRVAFDRQRGAPPSPIGSSRHVAIALAIALRSALIVATFC